MKRTWTIIGVSDVPGSFKWYQALFGQPETLPAHDYFGQILDSDGTVLLCLHEWGAHEHPSLMSPDHATPGNGILLFFRVDDFDMALQRARALVTRLEEEPHVNPNTQTKEFSLRDPDGYYVTISALSMAPSSKNTLLQSLHDFLRLEAAGGLVLMAAAVLALLVANSPLAAHYAALVDVPLSIRIGTFGIAKPLLLWINDGLMAVFFFLVGMELKREMLEGHLKSLRQATLPAFAAAGGMLAPAALYWAFNSTDAVAMKGWAIPTATDIAFALGGISLLGKRVPTALKAFLLSVAIFDDLGAMIVIALFYTANLSLFSLAVASGLILGLAALNRAGVVSPAAYILVGIALWVALLKSGVHATLAGVVLAMFIPLRVRDGTESPPRESPLRHLEHTLHPWVTFGILPVFAFANAGVSIVDLSMSDMLHPVPLGIVAGLFLGKQIGVLVLCWIATRARIASLPEGVGWGQLHGASLLCGIGFTMSLFIASLAFEQGSAAYLGLERLGILVGSLLCGLLGYTVLRVTSARTDEATQMRELQMR